MKAKEKNKGKPAQVAASQAQPGTLKEWLKERGVEVVAPSRKAFCDYNDSEEELVLAISSGQADQDAALSASKRLRAMQNEFVAKTYPGLDVDQMPANLFWDLLMETMAMGRGAVRGN